MKLKFIFRLIGICIIPSILHSQENSSISGKVLSKDGATVHSLIELIKVADTQVVKREFSDPDGRFLFTNILSNTYYLRITALGNKIYHGKSFFLSEKALILDDIILEDSLIQLEQISIVAQAPRYEKTAEGYTFHVAQSTLAEGNNVMELLEKTPGISISSADQISMNGKSHVQVMIDGKIQRLDQQQLSNYLRTLPSSNVSAIKVIQRPPARLDAEGRSGFIDIKLKKDKKLGTHGNINSTAGHGRYYRANIGTQVFHNTARWNNSLNYTYAYNQGFNLLDLERNFSENGQYIGSYVQNNFLTIFRNNQTGGFSSQYKLTDKLKMGIQSNGFLSRFNPVGDNVSYVLNSDHQRDSKFTTHNQSHDRWYNGSFNFFVKHELNNSGKEWNLDFDWAQFGNTTDQLFTTKFLNLEDATILPDYILFGDLTGQLNLKSIKFDWVHPLTKTLTYECGSKLSHVTSDNNLLFFDQSNVNSIFDSTKSNHFIFNETIWANYFSVNLKRNKSEWQAGLRSEFTNNKGEQLVYDSINTNRYLQFFPSISYSYELNSKNQISLGVNRRIDRPSYDQLNPFKFFLDPTTYKEGNPYLFPQSTWNIDLSYSLLQKYHFQITASRTSQNITEVIIPDDKVQTITIQTNRNLTELDYLGFQITAPWNLSKKWTSQWNVNTFYSVYKGNLSNTPLQKGNFAYTFSSMHQFKLNQKINFESNFIYNSPALYAYLTSSATHSFQLGCNYRFAQGKANIKLSFQDIFYGLRIDGTSTFKDYFETFHVERETRLAVISFSYKLGSLEGQMIRRRSGGAEEEKRRAGNQG